VQLAIWQTLLAQIWFLQSALPAQPVPSAHGPQVPPPQSTPLSAPFLIPSLQAAAWQSPPTHTPLVQSLAALHAPPTAQGAQAGPPQSTPVSAPLRTLSLHAAGAQIPLRQTPVAQSLPTAQPSPVLHGGQVAPPQSVDDSAPFCTPSVHVGAAQTPFWQTPLVHSGPWPQCWPLLQGSASQPLAVLPSQSKKPVLQPSRAHVPLAQLDVPFAAAQGIPQPPQSAAVARLVSQPVAALPSQSPKPALHEAITQAPPAQAGAAPGNAQVAPHAPQSVIVVMAVSQPFCPLPSQSAKPAAQVTV
jgi:hypothetical protein